MNKIFTLIFILLFLFFKSSAFGVVDADLSYKAGVKAFVLADFKKAKRLLENAVKAGIHGDKLNDCYCKLYFSIIELNQTEKLDYYGSKCDKLDLIINTKDEKTFIDRDFIIDNAKIIEKDIALKIRTFLKELEQKTEIQMAIVTIDSLKGKSIEDFAIELAYDKLKLGQKGRDNGVLLLVAVNDRKYRIEIGYGLEGVLPNNLVGSIGRQYLVPYFKKGDYSRGLLSATLAMMVEISRYSKDTQIKIRWMSELDLINSD